MTDTPPTLQFTKNTVLRLFHGTDLIGTVTNLDIDWPWYGGQVKLTEAAKPFAHIWEFYTTEGNRQVDPPFEIPDTVYQNWFVEDESGQRLALDDLPAVHTDGSIWWQFD